MNLQTIFILLLVFIAYIIGKNTIGRVVRRIGRERHIAAQRVQYVGTAISVVWTILAITAAGVVTGFGYKDVSLFFGSTLAILGIAMFAHWSILSNITSSVVVFFFFPYRVGHYVKILDGDNTVEGRIREITLFHVILEFGDHLITYPNTMVFQKAVQITPRARAVDVETVAEQPDTK